MLEFLQAHFSAGLAHSTLKVYVAAIAAYNAPLGGLSVGKTLLLHVSPGANSGIPTRAMLHSFIPPVAPHMLLSLLVITSPAHDVLPIVCTDYTYDSDHGIAEDVPLAFDAVSRSLREPWLHT